MRQRYDFTPHSHRSRVTFNLMQRGGIGCFVLHSDLRFFSYYVGLHFLFLSWVVLFRVYLQKSSHLRMRSTGAARRLEMGISKRRIDVIAEAANRIVAGLCESHFAAWVGAFRAYWVMGMQPTFSILICCATFIGGGG